MAVRLLLRRLLLLFLLPLLLLSSWLPIHCAGGASLAEAFEQVADGMFAYMTKIRTLRGHFDQILTLLDNFDEIVIFIL